VTFRLKSPGPIITATVSLPRAPVIILLNVINMEQTPGIAPSYDASTDGEMRMIGTKIEGWVGSSPILAAPGSQTSPEMARGIIA
jgi:hypothetical protein